MISDSMSNDWRRYNDTDPMKKGSNPALVTLLLSVAAAAGYIAFRLLAPEPAEDVQPEATAPTTLTMAERLPEFALDALNGEPLSIDSWPGQPLLVNFWATWCAPCLREIPMLKAFQVEHPGVQVVGVAIDRPDPVRAFAEEMQFNYPVMVGEAEAINAAAAFGVDFVALPFTVFTAPDGRMLGVHTGEIHPEHLDNLIGVLTDLDEATIDIDTARRRLAGFL